MLSQSVFPVPSKTEGHRDVEVRTAQSGAHAGDQYLWCPCGGWRFALKSGGCKHVKAVAALMGLTLVDGTHIA